MHQLCQTFKGFLFIGAICFLLVAASGLHAQSSLDLTGVNDYAFTPDAGSFDFDGSFTIDLQFRSTNAVNGCLLAKFHQSSGSTLDDSYYLTVETDGSLEARIQTTSVLATLTGGSGVHDGNWHHVALVYDIDAEISELYLDGVLVDNTPLNGPVRNSSEPIRLGTLRTTGALTTFFDGYIDELRFWDVARRAEQAGCLRTVTILEDTPGLVSYYHFDENGGADAFDLISPFENFQLVSGSSFAEFEPTFASRLSGAGQCLCGNIMGSYSAIDPDITLVGDTVQVANSDSLYLSGTTVTIDSSVSLLAVKGYLVTALDGVDSCFFAPQTNGFAGGIEFNGDTTSFISHTVFVGFSDYALRVNTGLAVQHSSFTGPANGVLADNASLTIDSCDFSNFAAPTGAVVTADSCRVLIEDSRFHGNSGLAVMQLHDVAPFVTGEPIITRSLFHDNAVSGDLISLSGDTSPLVLRNLTVVGNNSASLLSAEPEVLVSSSILLGNLNNELFGSDLDVYYSLVSDVDFLNQHENFESDPLFLGPVQRNFGLSAGSPAINRGDLNPLFNDPDGTRDDIGAIPAGNFAPELESILDVPHDNGRQVMVEWLPSNGDDSRGGIAAYSLWRKVNLATLENFELVAELPAGQLPGYGQIALTLADSNQLGQPYYCYFVRAHSQNSLAFWDTPLDSGYSVDNLSPATPGLLATIEENGIRLTWEAVPDTDLAYYAIYRADSSFDPDTLSTIYATTIDTTSLDLDLVSEQYAYVVRAVDMNGNFSDASNLELIQLTFLPAPFGLTIQYSSNVLTLRWYGFPEVGQYGLYRSSDFGANWNRFATTPDTFFVTSPSTDRYLYRVYSEQ